MGKHGGNQGGRPTDYSKELAIDICRRLADGESLLHICRDKKMPDRSTVNEWLVDGKHKWFTDNYTHARAVQADNMFDDIIDISDNGSNDYYQKEIDGGRTIDVPDHEHMARSRLRVDSRKWYLSKVLPKKFGDRIQQDVEVSGKGMPDAMAKLTEFLTKGEK